MPDLTPPSDGQPPPSFFDDPYPYRPFLDHRGPGAPTSPSADPARFLQIPIAAVVGGLINSRGRAAGGPCYDAAVLSVMSWFWQQSRGHAGTLVYHDGMTVEVGPDEFVLSTLSVAATLWVRFRRAPVPAAGLYDGAFRSFYERSRLAVVRLRHTVVDGVPLVTHLGPARPDVEGKASDGYGQRWTMTGSVVDRVLDLLPPCGPQLTLFYGDLLPHHQTFKVEGIKNPSSPLLKTLGEAPHCDSEYVQEWPLVGPVLDVARAFDALTALDLRLHDRLVEAAAKSGGLDHKERPVNALAWQRRRAKGKGWGGAHLTTGAWQEGQATSSDRRDRPCAVPFIVADVDASTADHALPVVLALLDRLVALGAPRGDLVVSFTGNRGFHLRIPHGLVGRPMFPNAAVARRVVGGFFERLCEGLSGPDGPLIASIDTSLFSPVHLVRAVGSEHEKVPGCRSVTYRGDHFLELCDTSWYDVVDIVTIQSRLPRPSPFLFPDPDRTFPVPALEAMLRSAAADAQTETTRATKSSGDRTASRGIIEAIRRGVRPGEEFAPGHVGRTYAALLLAINLLTHGRLGEAAAWAELEQWNGANPVPIGEAEGDTDGELERVFDRACRFVAREGRSPSSKA